MHVGNDDERIACGDDDRENRVMILLIEAAGSSRGRHVLYRFFSGRFLTSVSGSVEFGGRLVVGGSAGDEITVRRSIPSRHFRTLLHHSLTFDSKSFHLFL